MGCRPLLVALIAANACEVTPAYAQESATDRFMPPIAGTWDPVRSMGQPPRWKPFIGFGFGFDRAEDGGESQAGPTGTIGVYKDIANPIYGWLGLGGQFYLGQRGERFDLGGRLYLESRAFFVRGGIDWNERLGRTDLTFGATFPVRRGGWFRRGGELRVDWVPGRGNSLVVGAVIPIAQPFAGRTRPRQVAVPLPRPPRAERLSPPARGTMQREVLDQLDHSMGWLMTLHNIFWLTDHRNLSHDRTVARSRQALVRLRQELAARASLLPDRMTYEREVEHYHGTLDRAFGLAIGATPAEAQASGQSVATRARRVVLEEVILPYNRTIGRYKDPDALDGLATRARARFITWLELNGTSDADGGREALRTFDAWIDIFGDLRRSIARITGDSRMHWLPLALVLRPEEHETQAQIDILVEQALGHGFIGGNAVLHVNAPQFQVELERTIHETETYHVLWIHDYRGRDDAGNPDRTAFRQTSRGYLRALIEQVRRYDETGRLPVYIIMLDQYYYDFNDARLWLDLLEKPLTHKVQLASAFHDMRDEIEALQDSLRMAVGASRRLNAEVEAFGEAWVEHVIKVHVNVTYPSDFSFRSRHLLGLPVGADNLMRDHRKIVIRDVTEADPKVGEVILTGVGVGDNYASPMWDDGGLILQGAATLEAKAMARAVLEQNNLRGANVPAPLRPVPFALDYGPRVRELEQAGATARVLQAHNQTGWGDKDATFVQMLLYDLAPPGSVLYIPDSLWTSYEWMAQLVSAALRGCRVYIVAPARANAPSAGFPQGSTMQELITRLILVEEQLGDVIREAGGELRIGLYSRRAPLDDVPGRVTELESTFQRYEFLNRLFPFSDSAWALIRSYAERPVAANNDQPVTDDARGLLPKMHRKTQLLATGSLIESLANAPGMIDVLDATLRDESEGAFRASESGPIPEQDRMQTSVRLFEAFDRLPRAVRDTSVLYFMAGSINKDVRSMALDGEVLAVIAGRWALQAYIDFFLLSGSVTWVERIEDAEVLMPPYSMLQRWIGRRLQRIL